MYYSGKWMLIAVSLCVTASAADGQRSEGPIISVGSEIILENDQNFTITCKGNRPINFKHQELPEDVVGPFCINQRNLSSPSPDYPYAIALDLFNVDQFAVGYYACFDSTLNESALLNSLSAEPQNTEHVSYVYVYVNGSESLIAPLSEFIILENGITETVIGCRPTAPDINMSLMLDFEEVEYETYSPKVGFLLDNDVFRGLSIATLICSVVKRNYSVEKKYVFVYKYGITGDLEITGGEPKLFLDGESFTLNCSIKFPKNGGVSLSWITPPGVSFSSIDSKSNDDVIGSLLYRTITVNNATKASEGLYTCRASSSNSVPKNKSVQKTYLDKPFLRLTSNNMKGSREKIVYTNTYLAIWTIEAYPKVEILLLNDVNEELSLTDGKIKGTLHQDSNIYWLGFTNLTVDDTGNYTLLVRNKYMSTNFTFSLKIKSDPIINVSPESPVFCVLNKITTLTCEVKGYPLPTISWDVSDKDKVIQINETNKQLSVYKGKSWITILARDTAYINCTASNSARLNVSVMTKLKIYEINGGFGIKNTESWFAENQNVRKECIASIYNFSKVDWLSQNDTRLNNVAQSETKYSHVATLNLERISIGDAKIYKCVGLRNNNTIEDQSISITVEPIRSPVIYESNKENIYDVISFQPVEFSCEADGVPQPYIEWFKDNEPLINSSKVIITTQALNQTAINSTVKIIQVRDENKGKYECKAVNNYMDARKSFHVVLQGQTLMRTIIIVTVILILLLIILVTWLVWKIRKEKQFKRELKAAGLYFFKKGLPPSLNPELMIDEQAELLPYDEKFEFPQEKLTLGKQLGAGAFGVVYKAIARGIIDAEESTTVAVKVVKKTADNQCIKALASELKIMVHLGKHINIVNLLGACTKNIGKRELMVIVEYCKFGNLHNYMQKHREVFVDTLTDNKDNNLGKVNRGYSCSSANSGTQFDYFGSNHTQETDHTFVNNTGNTNSRMLHKTSESGYVSDTNYESDSIFDGCRPRPLYSRDLLCWAFQIARGMEYLASRKVLHGDLAARNILLSDDNIVKICDFGLARSVYKDEEYQKKENCLLPVKWLAVECMTDRIFSTQSDVWAYGIVLWELFSLAKTPYPNISPHNLLEWLSEGKRLEKPMYADDRLYDVMLRCWEHKPTARPMFGELQEIVGNFLEDSVRNHYVDLNTLYVDINKKQVGKEDYLDMVCAPDYSKMVAPSPHHYVNDGICTIQLQQDGEGYLQMSPAFTQNSLRPAGSKFDFDVRKLKTSESSQHESELTPMLTLNNLATRSGSDSDAENNPSPYLNVKSCTRIDEEVNDVFDEKQNNLKNMQNGVTNPTYITLDANSDKKPKGVNEYINVPNSLVT